MDSYSENTEWIDIYDDLQNNTIEPEQLSLKEVNDDEKVNNDEEENKSTDTQELIDSIVANIIDNAIETAQTDLYTEIETSSNKELQEENDNNGFYYDVFKLVSVLAGCKLFFEIIEWAN
jgi:uncharacterized protein with ATP-grasp and redox domains